MAWLDFLKHGNELTELLIEGDNPYSASLLQAADVAPLQTHITATDQVVAYVLGRVVLAGRALWVLTDRQLLITEPGSGHSVQAVPLSQIAAAQCLRGKYGYTLRITIARQQFSMYGASAALATAFYQALGRTLPCPPVFKPAQLDADDLAQAQDRIRHAAALLQPASKALA